MTSRRSVLWCCRARARKLERGLPPSPPVHTLAEASVQSKLAAGKYTCGAPVNHNRRPSGTNRWAHPAGRRPSWSAGAAPRPRAGAGRSPLRGLPELAPRAAAGGRRRHKCRRCQSCAVGSGMGRGRGLSVARQPDMRGAGVFKVVEVQRGMGSSYKSTPLQRWESHQQAAPTPPSPTPPESPGWRSWSQRRAGAAKTGYGSSCAAGSRRARPRPPPPRACAALGAPRWTPALAAPALCSRWHSKPRVPFQEGAGTAG